MCYCIKNRQKTSGSLVWCPSVHVHLWSVSVLVTRGCFHHAERNNMDLGPERPALDRRGLSQKNSFMKHNCNVSSCQQNYFSLYFQVALLAAKFSDIKGWNNSIMNAILWCHLSLAVFGSADFRKLNFNHTFQTFISFVYSVQQVMHISSYLPLWSEQVLIHGTNWLFFNYSWITNIMCNVLSINAVPKAFSSSEGPCWERKKMQLCNVKPYLCVCCRKSGFSLIAESQCALMHWPFAPYARCRCAGVWGHLRTAFTTSQRHNCSSSP